MSARHAAGEVEANDSPRARAMLRWVLLGVPFAAVLHVAVAWSTSGWRELSLSEVSPGSVAVNVGSVLVVAVVFRTITTRGRQSATARSEAS